VTSEHLEEALAEVLGSSASELEVRQVAIARLLFERGIPRELAPRAGILLEQLDRLGMDSAGQDPRPGAELAYRRAVAEVFLERAAEMLAGPVCVGLADVHELEARAGALLEA
jgi:hypothetical protein